MAIVIGSAKYDENGKISGGLPGDQTGKEVSTQNYYMHSKGWYLLRPINSALANGLAVAMLQACNNNNIGYDQANRLSVINNLKTYKILGSIKVPCECDCSSLIRACCIQNGFDPGNFTTVNLADMLEKSGFFSKRVSVDSKTVLKAGDVLVTKSKGHTVMVVNSPNSLNTNISAVATASSVYKVNSTYTLTSNMYVRDKNGNNKKWDDLTSDGKSHAYKDAKGNPILRSGTRITAKSILNKTDKSIWIECPSGYVCAVDSNGKVYIK